MKRKKTNLNNSATPNPISKKQMREQLEFRRRTSFVSSLEKKSEQAASHILYQDWFVRSKTVAMYASESFEFSTRYLFDLCIAQNKEVYFPTFNLKDKKMAFYRVKKQEQLSTAFSKIAEPLFGPKIEPYEIDIFFVPLVAFDRRGNRLGRGGGFYDRMFASKLITGVKVGVGFDFQRQDHVPNESFDIKMDYILTEKELRKTS